GWQGRQRLCGAPCPRAWLRTIFAGLASPTRMGADAIAALGLSVESVNPNIVDFVTVITRLGDAGVDFASAVEIVGREGASALLALTANAGRLGELTANFQNANGALEEMARIIRDDLRGDIDALGSAVSGLFLSLGDAGLTAGLRQAFQGATDAVRALARNAERIVVVFQTAAASAAAWVAGMVAARAATLGFVGSLRILRLALLRLGIPAVVLGISELIFRLGGFGEAFRLISDAAGELGFALINRFLGIDAVVSEIRFRIRSYFADVFASILNRAERFAVQFSNYFIDIENDIRRAFSGIGGIDIPIRPRLDLPALRLTIGREARDLSEVFQEAFVFDTPAIDELGRRLREVFTAASDAEPELAALRGAVADVGPTAQQSLGQAGQAARDLAIQVAQANMEIAASTARQLRTVGEDLAQRLDRIYDRAVTGASRVITNAITGLTSFADAARSLALNLIGDILSALIRSQIFSLLGSFGLPLPGGLVPGRQFGGPVNAGRPYIVGESGPELFVPGQNGQVVPNGSFGGGMVINFSPVIQSADGPAVRRALAESYPIFEERVRASIGADLRRPSAFNGR
ncbi:MAG: phage tail tape measure protein, partial [Alphaproteobacteria bacterium]|nr:phage tail tape measure protein [Alphaproteobacteria bacterium]